MKQAETLDLTDKREIVQHLRDLINIGPMLQIDLKEVRYERTRKMSRHTILFEDENIVRVYDCDTDEEAAKKAVSEVEHDWEIKHIECPSCGHRWHKDNYLLVTKIKNIKKDY